MERAHVGKRAEALCAFLLAGVFFAECPVEPVPLPPEESVVPTASVEIRVTGLRNREGTVRVSLFASAEGFPGSADDAVRSRSVRIGEGPVAVRFESLPPGSYAVAVLHDENENGTMDRGFFGIPTEGYGVSNNPPRGFGAPRYEDAVFTLEPGTRTLEVQVGYHGGSD